MIIIFKLNVRISKLKRDGKRFNQIFFFEYASESARIKAFQNKPLILFQLI